jgi:hypothetical protein
MKFKIHRPSDLKRCHCCYGIANAQHLMGYFVQTMRRYDERYRNNNRVFCSSKCVHTFYGAPLKYSQLYVSWMNRLSELRSSGRKFSGRGFLTRHNGYVKSVREANKARCRKLMKKTKKR